jgi:beta-lactamase regulating signal transducer with metallopeptidase domain
MIPSAPLAAPALALLAKATLVIGVAGLATASPLGRRASAATRHLVWLLAIVALLALPLLGAVLPAWRVASVPASLATPQASAPAAPTTASSADGTAATPGLAASQAQSPAIEPAANEPPARETASAPARSRVPLWAWLAMAYAAGAMMLLAQVVLGRGEVRRLARHAALLNDDPEWGPLLKDLAWMEGIDRRVTLLRSRRSTMPMTWGTLRPTILLPHDADGWTDERKRVVLLHELAHVARHDCLSQMAAGVACALYWMHPGVWFAARRLRVERELACDDRVLAAGTRAREYAEHLLDVARTLRPERRTGAVAVSMARPSHLEGRMLAVLDQLRSRRAPSPRAVGAAAAASALLLVPVAAATVGAALGPAAGVLPAVGAVHAAWVPAVPQEQIVERMVDARPGGRLTLDLETGGELEIVGWDRDAVFLHAELSGRDWRYTRVELSPEGGGATLRTRDTSGRSSYSTSHRFQLRVPRSIDVGVQSGGGGITLRGLEGDFAGQTRGGSLVLKNVRGRVQLTTRGGPIEVTDSRLDGSLRTNGGDVRLTNVQGNVQGWTASGQVLREGRNADGGSPDGTPVRIHRAGGIISVDDAPYGADLSTGGGAITVGRARGFVRAHTGGGRILLGEVDGDVVASTGSGAVRVALTAPAGERTVDVRSGSGGVTIGIPAGVGVELDVETGYTPSSRPVTIDSDFGLPVTESRDYESVQGGTPRRFVRTRGRVGDGRVHVTVRTVNGSVHLRRIGPGSGPIDCVGPECTFATAEGQRLLAASLGGGDGSRKDANRRAAESLERTIFSSGDPRTQREATESLTNLPDYVGLDGLVRIALRHPGTEARRAAAAGLGRMACDESIATLVRMIDTERDGAVRQRAVKALAATIWRTDVGRHARPEEIRAILTRIAQSHPDGSVRAEARKELAVADRQRG